MTASIRKASRNRTRAAAMAALALPIFCSSIPAAPGAQDLVSPVAADNVVLQWDNACLEAIRQSSTGPTVVSRAIAVLHTAIFDAWSAYDAAALPTIERRGWRRPSAERTDAN